ncbi:MAG: hypothetical protein ABJA85_01130 [Bacteroidota bacterium]
MFTMFMNADNIYGQSKMKIALDSAAVKTDKEDPVTRLQSADAFNSLEDGQPTPPGYVEFRLLPTWAYSRAENNIFGIEPEIEYTPKGGKFLENAQVLASFFLEHDGTDNSGQLNLGWNQRWIKDAGPDKFQPTFGTLVEINFPLPGLRNTTAFKEGSKAGSFVKITAVIAKFVGPGSLYLNCSARRQFGSQTTSDGDVWTKNLFGYRLGYMWVIKEDKLNIIADINNESNEFKTLNTPGAEEHLRYNTFELSAQMRLSKHVTIGPGFLVGLDGRDETPSYGLGILLLVE